MLEVVGRGRRHGPAPLRERLPGSAGVGALWVEPSGAPAGVRDRGPVAKGIDGRASGSPSSAPTCHPRSTPTHRPTPGATIPLTPCRDSGSSSRRSCPNSSRRSATSAVGTASRRSTSRPSTPWPRGRGSWPSAPGAAATPTSSRPSPPWSTVTRRRSSRTPTASRASWCRRHSVRAALRVHTQAALQGIGFIYSSGDDGDWSNDGSFSGPLPSASFHASSPLATAVGGTSLGVAADGTVALERGWTTGTSTFDPATRTFVPGGKGTFMYGAGGGPSRLFDQPSYQQGVVPNGMAGSLGAPRRRVSPTSAWSGTRTRACWSARPRPSPRASATTSTGSAGPACRRRCSPA